MSILSERLARLLDLRPQQAETLSLMTVPVIIAGDATGMEETDAFSFRPAAGSIPVVASAGNPSAGQLYNPARSGFWLELRRIEVVAQSATQLFFSGIHTGALATATANAQITDRRIDNAAVGVIRWANAAPTGGVQLQTYGAAAGFTPLERTWDKEQVILPPGFGFSVWTNSNNVTAYFGFEWIERKSIPTVT